MDEKLNKIFKVLNRDLNPDTADLKNTSEEVISLTETDSCIKISDNNILTIRISEKSDKTAYAILGFLLQLININGHKIIVDTISDYTEFCDKTEKGEEEDEKDPINVFIEKIIESSSKIELKNKTNEKGIKNNKQIIQCMLIDSGKYEERMFESISDFPEIKNIKIIIEE